MDIAGSGEHSPWHYQGRPVDRPLIETTNLRSVLLARVSEHAGRDALVQYDGGSCKRRWSYHELSEHVRYMACELRERYPLKKGDRVLVISNNCAEVFMAYLALMCMGCVVVPINNRESLRALRFIAADVEPSLLVAGPDADPILLDDHSFPVVRAAALLSERGDGAGRSGFDGEVVATDLAVILYTSGTTAAPKGVCLSHYNLLINAEALRHAHDLTNNPVHMCVLPLFHANAFGFSMVASIYSGCTVVLCDGLPGVRLWSLLREERVNILSVVPEILRTMSLRPGGAVALPDLRYVVSAAAPLDKSVATSFEASTGIRIHQGYGLSECTNFAAAMPFNVSDVLRSRLMTAWKVPSIGSELFGTQIRVASESGSKEAAAEEEGEIVIAGHNVMQGYWRCAEQSHEVFAGGWLRTGDLGFFVEIDAARYFFITGRKKEIIIRYGEKVSPRSVEQELQELRALGPMAACGFKNQSAGEEIGLYIQAEMTPAARTRAQQVAQSIAARYRPRVILFGSSPVPATVTGKIQRARLAQAFGAYERVHLGNLSRVESAPGDHGAHPVK